MRGERLAVDVDMLITFAPPVVNAVDQRQTVADKNAFAGNRVVVPVHCPVAADGLNSAILPPVRVEVHGILFPDVFGNGETGANVRLGAGERLKLHNR